MATHCGILAWEIAWTEESGELQSRGLAKESDTTWLLNNNSAYQNLHHVCLFVCLFFHLPVGLSDLNIFQMPFILLWGEEGAQNIPWYRFGIHFLSIFPIEGHPNLDSFGQRVFCLFVFHRKE